MEVGGVELGSTGGLVPVAGGVSTVGVVAVGGVGEGWVGEGCVVATVGGGLVTTGVALGSNTIKGGKTI